MNGPYRLTVYDFGNSIRSEQFERFEDMVAHAKAIPHGRFTDVIPQNDDCCDYDSNGLTEDEMDEWDAVIP